MKNRFELRKSRYTPVVVSHDDWLWPETLVASEVSPRGLFISSDHQLPHDEMVRVCFRLGTPDYWDFHARVVHGTQRRRQNDWGFSGLGLELVDASPLERMQMRNLLRRYPPPIPLACRKAEGTPSRRRLGRAGGRRADDPRRQRSYWFSRFLT
jgi:hypothetical protein